MELYLYTELYLLWKYNDTWSNKKGYLWFASCVGERQTRESAEESQGMTNQPYAKL